MKDRTLSDLTTFVALVCPLLMAANPGSGPSAKQFQYATRSGEACISVRLRGPGEAPPAWEHHVVRPDGGLIADDGDCTVPLPAPRPINAWLAGPGNVRVALADVGQKKVASQVAKADRLMMRWRGEDVLLMRFAATLRTVQLRVRETESGLLTVWAVATYRSENKHPQNAHEVFWVINTWTGSGRLIANSLLMQDLPFTAVNKARGLTELQVHGPLEGDNEPTMFEYDARLLRRHAKTLRRLNLGAAELSHTEVVAELRQLRAVRIYEWENYGPLEKLPLLEEVVLTGELLPEQRTALRARFPKAQLDRHEKATMYRFATPDGEPCESGMRPEWRVDEGYAVGKWKPVWVLDPASGERSLDGARCTVPMTRLEPVVWARSRTSGGKAKREIQRSTLAYRDDHPIGDPTIGITVDGEDFELLDVPYISAKGFSLDVVGAGTTAIVVEFNTEYGASNSLTNWHHATIVIDRRSGQSLVLTNDIEHYD